MHFQPFVGGDGEPALPGIGGVQGILLRMADKMSRLWNLSGMDGSNKTILVGNETLSDTLLDMANYAILGQIMTAGKWSGASLECRRHKPLGLL